jgi:hypothetical protein
LHSEQFVQLIDSLARAALGRKHCQKLLQFMVVEPQAVTAGTFVEGQGGGASVFDLNLVQRGVAPRTQMRTALWFHARLVLEFQQWIGGRRARALHDGFQLARREPESAALMAEMDFEVPEMQDEQGHITFWTDASHTRPRVHDGACEVNASSTSRIVGVVAMLFIGGNQPEERRNVIYKCAVCL